MTRPIRSIVCEDEPVARQHLVRLVKATPALSLIGTASDGQAALALIESTQPALVFMDVQMPELDGVAVLAAARHRPRVVFTTAFDRYAVQAFELGSVDYLLKPFGVERFNMAVGRILHALGTGETADALPIEVAAADGVTAAARARELRTDGPLARVFVRERGRIVPVSVREIERIEAEDDHAGLWVRGRRHLVQVPIGELAARLDPARFIRVHRSHIVNLDFVMALVPYDAGRLQVELRDGSSVLASRSGSQALRELML
jgi:two-component system, LytTR family, response regulator